MQLLHGLSVLLLILCLLAWLLLAALSRMAQLAAIERQDSRLSNKYETGIDWTLKVFVSAMIVWAITGWFILTRNVSREGEVCGPRHHWKLVGTPGNDDLTCEADS